MRQCSPPFAQEAAQRWDLLLPAPQVLASQRVAIPVATANATGTLAHWDYQPPRDASRGTSVPIWILKRRSARPAFPRVRFD
jgi:choline-sulfatase